MSEGIAYADIIIIALVVGFVLLRLRSVLGQHQDEDLTRLKRPSQTRTDENEEEPARVMPLAAALDKRSHAKPPAEAAIVDPAWAALEEGEVKAALTQIRQKDTQFNVTAFLQGAKLAYEMVFDAFAKADKDTLKMLLADDVYREFEQALPAGGTSPSTLVSVRAKKIETAKIIGTRAQLSVSFDTEQMQQGTSASSQAHDEWVFERDITSKNPNWKIVET